MPKLSHANEALEAFGKAQLAALHPQFTARLYHYTSAENMANILRSGRLWAHNIGTMNDFIEVRYAASVFGAHLDRCYAVEPHPRVVELFRTMRKHLAEIGLWTVFTLSFSSNGDELGMWRLYADRGSGFSFCIPAFTLEQPWGGYLVKCSYSNVDLDRFCVGALHTIRKAYLDDLAAERSGTDDEYAAMFFAHIVWFGPVFKHAVWADEQEWRVIYTRAPEYQKKRPDGRTYIEIPASVDGRLSIEAICAGPNCDQEKVLRAIQALLRETGYSSIPVYLSNHPAGM